MFFVTCDAYHMAQAFKVELQGSKNQAFRRGWQRILDTTRLKTNMLNLCWYVADILTIMLGDDISTVAGFS